MPGEVIEKGIFLTFDEIRVLLYSMGVSELQGVYMPEKTFRDEEIIFAMHHMSEAGFIKAEEERFLIREDIKDILKIMAAPLRTDIWRPMGAEGPAFFLYFTGDEVVVSERYWRKKDTLKLTMFGKDDFEKWREEFMDDYRRD